MPIRKRNESGVAYIPADRHATGMVMDFTLSENLLLKNYYKPPYCIHGWLKRDQFDKKSSELIKQYDIRCGQGCDTIVRSMSGGNQQKAIIAREIDQNAKVILFVQPTRGLDIGAIENIHRQILEQRSKGKAILLISLELEEVMKLADTIGVIYSGELLKTAPAESLTVNQVGNYMMGVTT